MAEAPATRIPDLTVEQSQALVAWKERRETIGRIQDRIYALGYGWRIDDKQARRLLMLRHLADTGRVSEWTV